MGFLSVIQVILQLIICTKLITSQSSSTTLRSVKKDATIVGVEPFYNQTTFSLTECHLACLQQIEKCFYIEVANVREAWSCKLFYFYAKYIKKHLKPLKGSEIVSPNPKKYPKDCVELKKFGYKEDGVYSISNKDGSPIKVYCDMTTDGGGWIVIQKRFDGSVDFNRNWNDYKNGFGDVNGEYWLGNEFVHQYTKMYQTEMVMEAVTFDGGKPSTKLQKLTLSDELTSYIFHYDTCEGLCKGISYHKEKIFSTSDRDSGSDCAVNFSGGWWFSGCFWIYLNGRYSLVESVVRNYGIHWSEFRDNAKSMKETKMLIRRVQ